MPETWRKVEIRLLQFFERLGLGPRRIFLFWSIAMGAVCGLVAVSFHLLIQKFTGLFFDAPSFIESSVGWFRFLWVPAAGALVAGLFLQYLVPEARGSGIPQTKTAYFVRSGEIPFRVTLGKYLLSALSIGTGGSIGREGPTVQICAGLASATGRTISLTRDQVKTLLPVGAAAGLAAAFNTPIAAVTFTLEELVGDLNARVLGSIVLASVSAAVVERALLGDTPVFNVPAYSLGHPVEFVFYALLGVIAGLVSVAFIRGLLWLRAQCLLHKGIKAVLITGLGGLVIGAVAVFRPEIMGVGYGTVNQALNQSLPFQLLIVLGVLKLFGTIVSYASGTAGGIFAPSLFMGAMVGGSLGWVVHTLFPSLSAGYGAYALVGMGAVFAGVIRTPMTSVIIIFEMTQDYNIILPLMVANLVSLGIARWLERPGTYESLSMQDGVHLPSSDTRHILENIHVEDAMVREVVMLRDDLTVEEAIQRIRDLNITGFPMVDGEERLTGMVSAWDLKRAMAQGKPEAAIKEIGTTSYVAHAHPDQTLDVVLHKLGSRDISRLAVVNRENPQVVEGIITAEDVMNAFGVNRDVHEEGDVPEPVKPPPAAGTAVSQAPKET
ncbi:MAG: chloride channel protein [Nitrospinota bacterium]